MKIKSPIVTLLVGVLVAAVGLLNIASIVSLVFVVLGILIAVFVGKADGKAWFNRARY